MISVAVVEDNEIYRSTLVKIINDNKLFRVLGVYASAEDAITKLPLVAPDIAIMDIQLRSMSGIDLIKAIKPSLPDTQFLICTSYHNNENVFNALKAGASGYIVKDASSVEIQNAIIELFNGGSPMSPYIARKVINLLQNERDANAYDMSSRELEVITLLSRGLMYKEISEKLQISSNTVKNHLKSIYKKLHVKNKVEAINKYRSTN